MLPKLIGVMNIDEASKGEFSSFAICSGFPHPSTIAKSLTFRKLPYILSAGNFNSFVFPPLYTKRIILCDAKTD